MARRMLTLEDRAAIAAVLKARSLLTTIAAHLVRSESVMSRGRRNPGGPAV